MKTFVLIHGASHGGWCWKNVAEKLREQGAVVYTPTLTGMSERVHLLNESITMQTHIDDITNLIRYEDLKDVILVGHSYAGLIIPAVNEAMPERISSLIFLDSYLPEHGKTGLEILEKKYQDSWQLAAQDKGNGWKMLATEATIELWGVTDPKLKAFLLPRITDFSLNFLKTPIFLSEHFEKVKKTYIRCTQASYLSELMLPYYEKAKRLGWLIFEINTHHEPMFSKPDELAKILLNA